MRSQAVSIATGYMALSTAKAVFMVSGYAIYFTLPRILSPSAFGNYGVTIGFLSVFNMMLVISAIQTVSKFVSEKPEREPAVRSAAFRSQALFGGLVSVSLFAGAPFIALIFKDASLTPPLRIGAAIPLFYAFFATVIGSYNGRKLYHAQAGLDIVFALIKTVCVIGAAVLTRRVEGAVAGFLLTSILIACIAVIRIHMKSTDPPGPIDAIPMKSLLGFQASVMILTLLVNLLAAQDLFMVKALSRGTSASDMAGFYTSAQTISRIPQVLVIALALVLFPLVSSSTFENDAERSRRNIKAALRFPLVFIAPASIFISAFSQECLALVYPAPYIAAAPALQILGPSVLIFSMFQLGITVITGSGKPRVSIALTLACILCHAAANRYLIPCYGIRGAATGSAVGWTFGYILTAVTIFRRFRAFLTWQTLLRCGFSGTVTWYAVRLVSLQDVWVIPGGFAATVVLYWGLLWMTREVTLSELAGIIRRLTGS